MALNLLSPFQIQNQVNFERFHGEKCIWMPYTDYGLNATFKGLFSDVTIEQIDLLKKLIPHPSTTSCICAGGTNLKDELIRSGDYIITDSSIRYTAGKKIAYWLNDYGGWTVKILRKRKDGYYLEPTEQDSNLQFAHKITKYDKPLGMVSWILYREYNSKITNFNQGFFPESKDEKEGLQKLLNPRPSSTFCTKSGGDSMYDERIRNGDTLIIDKSLEYKDKKKIVYWLNDYNGYTVKILRFREDGAYLVPANTALYNNYEYKIQEYDKPWGMVTWNLHNEYDNTK